MGKKPIKKRRSNTIEIWEVSIVKAMLERGGYQDQDILSYFTRPTRTVNHRLIGHIRKGVRYPRIRTASQETLDHFLLAWPAIDPQTGLNYKGDELLIKAREAMISAVQTFNSAGLHFRSELFIVTAIISWTYLFHAFFKKENVDYRYYQNRGGNREIVKTAHGAEKHWELSKCLNYNPCPISHGAKQNLEFIIKIRHEIEHQSTNRIDDALSAKLQACCLNFNETIKRLFGTQFGLEKQLPLALQFVTFSPEQRSLLKSASGLPAYVKTLMNDFHGNLSPEELNDPEFAYRVALIQKIANNSNTADLAIEFIKPDSNEAIEINRVLLKETERSKFRPSQIVAKMQDEGYVKFNMHNHHTVLWKRLDAKNPAKGYGVQLADGQWYWYETWLNRVREHCQSNIEKYQENA